MLQMRGPCGNQRQLQNVKVRGVWGQQSEKKWGLDNVSQVLAYTKQRCGFDGDGRCRLR